MRSLAQLARAGGCREIALVNNDQVVSHGNRQVPRSSRGAPTIYTVLQKTGGFERLSSLFLHNIVTYPGTTSSRHLERLIQMRKKMTHTLIM